MLPGSSVAHLPPGMVLRSGELYSFRQVTDDRQKQKQSFHISPARKWSLDTVEQRRAPLWSSEDNPSNRLYSPTSPAHSSVQVLGPIQHRLIHLSSTSRLLIFASFQNSLGLSG